MLIDVSRKPVRVLPEECQTFVVIRTVAIRGKARGIIHREEIFNNVKKDYPFQPHVTLPKGSVEHIETILHPNPPSRPEIYTVSGFQDQITKQSGIWRVSFIFDPIKNGRQQLLTLIDETNNVFLFTVQVTSSWGGKLFEIMTPLKRFMHQQTTDEKGGLWASLREEDGDLEL